MAGNRHPDNDTILTFRKHFLPNIKIWFKEILLIGKEMKLVKMGNIYIDGTKVQPNASRHKAMSYDYMKKLEEEIETLLDLVSKQDKEEDKTQLHIPAEIKFRKDRL